MLIQSAIKRAMAVGNITSYRLSLNTGIPQSKLSEFLNHGSGIGTDRALTLAAALGIRITDKAGNSHPDLRSAIAAALAACGMLKTDFCHFYGFSLSALCNFLGGKRSVSVSVAERLMKRLGLAFVPPRGGGRRS